ncbi:GNAT family N-acetyltransferase [Rubinisphaera margarita]|uniref:GNAT family N-acetyltransferase n=1 Tax=Rubinisphaera margarita TaxID=2909586 RepID=UPI001EE7A65C|nr:GNAT family N-acetyltransferase [Rubinisphaera margarita]MCG6157119.1 GNAT family N-acetyltransferase [Rubinisphaera margarita]
MIRLDDFQGTPEDLAEFITPVWRETYQGRMVYPDWAGDFFRWQMRWDAPGSRRHMIAAYDEDRLIATLLGTSFPVRADNELIRGSIWSWMTIDPEYRGRGLATLLDRDRVRRLQDEQVDLIVSYRYFGSRHSLAEQPKKVQAKPKKFNRTVGLWVRVLDPRTVGRWSLKAVDGWMSRLSFPLAKVPGPGKLDSFIRRATEQDIPRCVELVREQTAGMPLTMAWDESTLRHQLLGSPLVTTLVLERSGAVEGFVSFHILDWVGRMSGKVGIFDLIVTDRLGSGAALALMNAAFRTMVEKGAILTVKVRTGDVPASLMWRCYFVPRPADSHLILQWVSLNREISSRSPIHLLWR